jgi:hypothetical protein
VLFVCKQASVFERGFYSLSHIGAV